EPRGVDLTDVERRIRKVGIERQCVGERRRHLVEGIAARGHARIRTRTISLPIAFHARRAIELDVEPDALTDIFNPYQVTGLADVRELERRIDSRPVDALVLVIDASSDVEAPGGLGRFIREALERNRKLRHPAVANDPRASVEDRVPLPQLLGVIQLELIRAPSCGCDLEVVRVTARLAGI